MIKTGNTTTYEMIIHARKSNPAHLGDEDIPKTGNFTYLGSITNVTGGTQEVVLWDVGKHSKLLRLIPAGRENKILAPQDKVENIQIGTSPWVGNLAFNKNFTLQSACVY